MLLRVVAFVIVVYMVLTAVVFFRQRRLLYLPRLERPSEPFAQSLGLAFWQASGHDYRGLIGTQRRQHARGTVMVFHGNAGAAIDRIHYVHALEPLGYRVLLMEYPGYGGRPGSPSETTLTRDARASIELARQAFGQPIFLWGESLGSGVVAAAVSDSTLPVAAVILLTPWDSLPRLAQTLYWYLPARWLVRDQFDNVANLRAFSGRVAVILAAQDEIIPRAHGLRLYQSVASRKQLWCFQHAGHNSWPTQPTAPWWREVMAFVAEDGGEADAGRGR